MRRRQRQVDRRRRQVFVVHDRRRPRWRRWFPAIVAILLAITAPMLAYGQSLPDSVTLAWTDTGDDANAGTATTLQVRMSTSTITATNWDQATVLPGAPTPGLAGTAETMVVRGLTNGTTYYFAVRLSDEAGNWSDLSNVIRWDWTIDTTAPSAPIGLSASSSGGSVHMAWLANSEPDLSGYNVYRAVSMGVPFTRINTTFVTGMSFVDASPPASATVWYGVRALDQSGNESAMSVPVAVSISEKKGVYIFPVYPNPSPLSGPVTIPMMLVSTTDRIRLDILDAGGRRVRGYDVRSLGEGVRELVWNGKNEAGLLVVPGVYTAVLRGGGVTSSARIVRTP